MSSIQNPVAEAEAKAEANGSEASPLTWDDTFFSDNEEAGVVAVFDFDYDKIEAFSEKVGWAMMLVPPVLVGSILTLTPCFLRQRISWDARAQHVCVTHDGIKYVRDKRSTCFGCACTDQGKLSKVRPSDASFSLFRGARST